MSSLESKSTGNGAEFLNLLASTTIGEDFPADVRAARIAVELADREEEHDGIEL